MLLYWPNGYLKKYLCRIFSMVLDSARLEVEM